MGERPPYGNGSYDPSYGSGAAGPGPAPVHPLRCPQCSAVLPDPPPALCLQCQFPLLLAEPDERSSGVADDLHRPSAPEVDDRTRLVPRIEPDPAPPVVAPQPEPQVPQMRCRACGWGNAVTRVRCERCAALLRDEEPFPAPPPPPPAPPRGGVPWWLVVVPVVLVAVLAGVAVWFVVLGPWAPGSSPTPGSSVGTETSPPAVEPTTLTRVDSSTVSVTASSVLPPDPEPYDPERTLDGDPRTAWNSDGNTLGAKGRPTLTYTFAEPVRVGRIEVLNGFQKDDRVFQRNCRVKTLVVTAGEVSHTFTLQDSTEPQVLTFDFGAATSSITLKVADVYPGTKYRDIALSEVVFYGLS